MKEWYQNCLNRFLSFIMQCFVVFKKLSSHFLLLISVVFLCVYLFIYLFEKWTVATNDYMLMNSLQMDQEEHIFLSFAPLAVFGNHQQRMLARVIIGVAVTEVCLSPVDWDLCVDRHLSCNSESYYFKPTMGKLGISIFQSPRLERGRNFLT